MQFKTIFILELEKSHRSEAPIWHLFSLLLAIFSMDKMGFILNKILIFFHCITRILGDVEIKTGFKGNFLITTLLIFLIRERSHSLININVFRITVSMKNNLALTRAGIWELRKKLD